MLESTPRMSIAQSRESLLHHIGEDPELTLVRGFGNLGDELIWAGQRELLSDRIYREITIPELAGAFGDTVLLSGGGAWSMAYHEHMPTVLAIAEANFRRVIVLPSTFDVRVDRVRKALANTRATIFAREDESYRRIAGLCDARMAHDCAFFFDYSPYTQSGDPLRAPKTLRAFRSDRESAGRVEITADNNDISVTATSLRDWLETISDHQRIQTDRAHVMIAAAMMNKDVEYSPGGYFKLDALAQTLPTNVNVQRRVIDLRDNTSSQTVEPSEPPVPMESKNADTLPAKALRWAPAIQPVDGQPRVCAVILSHNRPDMVTRSARSAQVSGPGVRTLIYDNNSDDRTRSVLTEFAAKSTGIAVTLADRNIGCAGGRSVAVNKVTQEFVLFLDDDAELLPGSLELLVSELDDHPQCQAVTANVLSPDGTVQHSGGSYYLDSDYARFTADGSGLKFDDLTAPATGRCDWVPGTAVLVRRSSFDAVPIDPEMSAYYEDNDWAIRMQAAFGEPFRRCREAIAIHYFGPRPTTDSPPALADHFSRRLQTLAHFYSVHNRILSSGGVEITDMLAGTGELSNDPATARLLLRIAAVADPEEVAVDWMAGDFAEVLASIRAGVVEREVLRAETVQLRADLAELGTRHSHALADRDTAISQRNLARTQRKRLRARQRAIERSSWWQLRQRLDPVAKSARKAESIAKRSIAKRVSGKAQ